MFKQGQTWIRKPLSDEDLYVVRGRPFAVVSVSLDGILKWLSIYSDGSYKLWEAPVWDEDRGLDWDAWEAI
jgi:hypothetical protein